jgi:ubiquinone/menaquinone biosynthesis C-methylase UbiE
MRRRVAFALGVLIGAFLAVRWITRPAGLITPAAFAPLLTSRLRLCYRRPAALIRWAGIQPSWVVLDLGCGNGMLTSDLAQSARRVYALDVQPAMIRRLRRRLPQSAWPRIYPLVASAFHLPFPAAAFDAVVMLSVLPMLRDVGMALGEVRRVLKPGGVLIVGEDLLEPEYVRWPTIVKWASQAGFALRGRSVNWLSYTLKFVPAYDS